MKKTTTTPTASRPAGDRLVSVAEAATYLGVNERTIRNMLYDGRLKAYRAGPRVVRLRLSEIDASLAPYRGE